MYRILFFSVSIALIFAAGACKVRFPKNLPESPPVSHSLWNDLLQKHVRADGFVHYKGFIQDSTRLNEYLALLSSTHPQQVLVAGGANGLLDQCLQCLHRPS
jgi:DNA-binding transcriptional MocR family regulator